MGEQKSNYQVKYISLKSEYINYVEIHPFYTSLSIQPKSIM